MQLHQNCQLFYLFLLFFVHGKSHEFQVRYHFGTYVIYTQFKLTRLICMVDNLELQQRKKDSKDIIENFRGYANITHPIARLHHYITNKISSVPKLVTMSKNSNNYIMIL